MILASAQAGIAKPICGGGLAPKLKCDIVKLFRYWVKKQHTLVGLPPLSRLIDAGPEACGFSGACWRSPMVQQLIKDQFGVSYNVFYIAHLLKHLGFSYQ